MYVLVYDKRGKNENEVGIALKYSLGYDYQFNLINLVEWPKKTIQEQATQSKLVVQ